ncbi:MarR family winged helix-turn-helix transcriptional regulator [Glutamicibacter sp. AOP5-A2-18]|uniref:MarR family winged helix-turn-helix transcriptional regulator n=1 Tax=Glutamicibacter sp. AOP5-A2-18 TaxID=3457656 RepID=UPI0040342D56
MEISSEGTDLPQALFDALFPLLGLVHAARTLSPGKIGILRTLAAEDHVSATRLSQVIGVSQQAISLTTKELESLGLIERHKDDSDRRKLWFRLTKTGQQKLDSEVQQGREALKQAIGNKLSDKELKLIHDAIPALTKIKTAAKR